MSPALNLRDLKRVCEPLAVLLVLSAKYPACIEPIIGPRHQHYTT